MAQRDSDPGPEEWCVSGPPMSSAPAQWPSTVQVVAEGPGEKGKGHLLPQHGSRLLEEIHLDSRRCRAGRADAGHQTEVTTQACEDGHLESHSMRTQGL